VKRLFVLVLAVVVAGVAVWVILAPPATVERIRYPLRYTSIVRGHARNYRIDPALLAAVIEVESKFEPDAKSRSGAIGLMQLLPSTAHGIAVHTGGSNFRTDDLYDPEINVRYGAWYLRHLLDKYGSERLALAAYNAGQTNVDRWRARGLPIQFGETRSFVEHVEHLKSTYRHAYSSLRQHKDT
jgi:soluble lytic murein transglycosylase